MPLLPFYCLVKTHGKDMLNFKTIPSYLSAHLNVNKKATKNGHVLLLSCFVDGHTSL